MGLNIDEQNDLVQSDVDGLIELDILREMNSIVLNKKEEYVGFDKRCVAVSKTIDITDINMFYCQS